MQTLNKRALSGVIASVLIILVAMAAIVVLGFAIKSLVQAPALSPKLNCLELQTSPPLEISKACYNSQTKEVQITVKRNTKDISISQLEFLIGSEAQNEKWACGLSCGGNCVILSKGQTKTYFFSPPEVPTESKVSISNCLIETKPITEC
jgi:hypothetical protein